ncbi:MAG: glycosyltransferase [Rhabdochlamydiaceae bacterium]|nr:glycosyltransferase [Candidatus Amphrikana amoebophyrae]
MLFFLLLPIALFSKEPTVCLNMIVKNEADVICNCLKSVKPYIDTWVIVDTGSTDGTQELIKNEMKDMPGHLYERPWIDFAHNRNEAMQLAQNKADYYLFIDADETLDIQDDSELLHLSDQFYTITVITEDAVGCRILLAKTDVEWEWRGVIHETLYCNEKQSSTDLKKVRLNALSLLGARTKDPNKYKKDIAFIQSAIQKDPSNTRLHFYLATTYETDEQYDQAYMAYSKCSRLDVERDIEFFCLYRMAAMRECLHHKKEDIIKAYWRAYYCDPGRYEPLYHIAKYYFDDDNILLSYILCQRALLHREEYKPPLSIRSVGEYELDLLTALCEIGMKFDSSVERLEQLLKKTLLPEETIDVIERALVLAHKETG